MLGSRRDAVLPSAQLEEGDCTLSANRAFPSRPGCVRRAVRQPVSRMGSKQVSGLLGLLCRLLGEPIRRLATLLSRDDS